ncbi:XRE family transcriptional regulator [Halomonas sp. YLB-10]|uniref:helix-turn-helix domain-containing protein n=1 Tax=Halomonas sp. YLB-10 TaxID=2483111 RepID=UPI000F5F0141|nr:helix-turn-helix transcriptional regulator [Halomonas sp. YLB-10]RQW69514.1 XRE family transcriptional regulator [Halomonas sp. YLB-10]
MAQTVAIVDALKAALRANGVTYQQVAAALCLSEASVKRLFAERQFSLQRLDQVCALVGLEITDLVRQLEPQVLVDAIAPELEQELVSDMSLLLVAFCALNRWRFEDICATYSLGEPQVITHLVRLDRMGLIELLPGNRIKLLISYDFQWQPQGPIQRFFESRVQEDFLACRFDRPGEIRLFVNGMLSVRSNEVMQQKLRRLALDLRHCHQEDLSLPLEQRFGVSLMIAMRPWEMEVFRRYRRVEDDKCYPGHGGKPQC